jgi:tetratricopeptide (TPR) repeat protein
MRHARDRHGIALSSAGDMPRAIQQFRSALQINPDNARTQNNLATALLRSGNIEQAIEHYEEAVKLDSSFVSAHKSVADAYRKSGQPEKAIEHYTAALRVQPDNTEILQNLMQTLASLNRSADAVAAAKQGIEAARRSNQTAIADQLEDWLRHYQIELGRGGSATTLPSEPLAK